MEKMTSKNMIIEMLKPIDVVINGQNPWDLKVHNEKFYDRVIQQGSLGLGESYMDEWWDCEKLDVFFTKILRSKLNTQINIPLRFKIKQLLARGFNLQSKSRAKIVGEKHYDLGQELFTPMLDEQMIYSCGYWKDAENLNDAQIAKLELICKKLQLKPGMHLLDIGCGWGGFAKYAAQKYKVNVVGLTISKNQWEFAQKNCQGLPIQIKLQDYRDIKQKFDRVTSIGMFEHVGHLNYARFFQVVHNILLDDGLFLLHTIGSNKTNPLANEWINKYIFPNGALPSISHIGKASENWFVMEDWHNFGVYYDKTLMVWHENFLKNWSELQQIYDNRFFRMWTYYLLTCAASFRARLNQLWQIVFTKKGLLEGYTAPR